MFVFFACAVNNVRYTVFAHIKTAFAKKVAPGGLGEDWVEFLCGAQWDRPIRYRCHRRRDQWMRHRPRRRRPRLVDLSLRETRSGVGDVERLQQTHPWRFTLPRTFRISFGARSADRARNSLGNRVSYRLAAALRPAPSQRLAPCLAAAHR